MKILNFNKLSWVDLDPDHIEVTFAGHFDENHAQLERDLNQAGLRAVRRKYDKHKNRTYTIYKKVK